jgi:hypothetical protein
MKTKPPMTEDDFISVLGGFAFALQAAMPAAQQALFALTLQAIAAQARQQAMPAVAAALDQVVGTLMPAHQAAVASG